MKPDMKPGMKPDSQPASKPCAGHEAHVRFGDAHLRVRSYSFGMKLRRLGMGLLLFGIVAGVALILWGDKLRSFLRRRDSALLTAADEMAPRIWGITIDRTNGFNATLDAVRSLPKPMTVRMVFDPGVSAEYYKPYVSKLHRSVQVMGEIMDSFDWRSLTRAQFDARVASYVAVLRDDVDIWEIGNEANGEWLGPASDVAGKIMDAFYRVRGVGGKTALTLYYNTGCTDDPRLGLYQWPKSYLSQGVREGIDYVFVSYWKEACQAPPQWNEMMNSLGTIFPNSYLGIGECGTTARATKASLIRTFYTLRVDHPRYVGGYFWWYFSTDMVPKTKPLWSVLQQAILASQSPSASLLMMHEDAGFPNEEIPEDGGHKAFVPTDESEFEPNVGGQTNTVMDDDLEGPGCSGRPQ
jgi:hypothetical protein